MRGAYVVVGSVCAAYLAACLLPSLDSLRGGTGASTPDGSAGVPDGAIVYYPFEEGTGSTTADKSGHGFNAVLSNDGVVWTTGKLGNALAFNLDAGPDGGGGSVDITGSQSPPLSGNASFSVTAWIFATGAPIDDAPIVSNLSGGSDVKGGFQLDTTIDKGPRTLGFKLLSPTNDAGIGGFRYGTTILTQNEWHFVAGVYDAAATAMHVYLDGKLDDGVLLGPVLPAFGPPVRRIFIGRRISASARAIFIGKIDEVRIFDRALSGDEITATFTAR